MSWPAPPPAPIASTGPAAAPASSSRTAGAGRSRTLSLKARALQLLARREHSRAELLNKLAPYEHEPGQLQRILDELQAKGFLNEERVIESVIHRRANKLGSARIRQELQAKGLPEQAVALALEQLRQSELERASEVWRRKFGAVSNQPKEQARQLRFLMGRGFSAEVARKIVG